MTMDSRSIIANNSEGAIIACTSCLTTENNQILLHFTSLSKSTRLLSGVLLNVLTIASVFLNISSIYFILHEVRRRTHINLLLSSQSLADLLTSLLVMLPISILVLSDKKGKPSYFICLGISFLEHWFHSVTMLNLAAIIVDRYKVIVQRQLSSMTRRTAKSMAIITVIWSSTFVFDVSYVMPYLRKVEWSLSKTCSSCHSQNSVFQWLDAFVNRITPFAIILYCFFRMSWLTYKSRHRIGVKNGQADWKTILIGIYAKSVNTCLVIMTLFLIGTLPDLAILLVMNWRQNIDRNAFLFAIWMRFSMTVIKPGIYMMQSRKFSFCWCSSCCRNVNMTTLVTFTNRSSTSARHSCKIDTRPTVSFMKAHDIFSIKLQIDELDASTNNTSVIEKRGKHADENTE